MVSASDGSGGAAESAEDSPARKPAPTKPAVKQAESKAALKKPILTDSGSSDPDQGHGQSLDSQGKVAVEAVLEFEEHVAKLPKVKRTKSLSDTSFSEKHLQAKLLEQEAKV